MFLAKLLKPGDHQDGSGQYLGIATYHNTPGEHVRVKRLQDICTNNHKGCQVFYITERETKSHWLSGWLWQRKKYSYLWVVHKLRTSRYTPRRDTGGGLQS